MRHAPSLRRRAGHRSGLLLIAGLLLGLTPATARAQATETVAEPRPPRAVLDSILNTPPLSRAHWGVAVYDLADGAPVLRHNADRLFTSASTMKLVTAAAALDLLGPDYRFETVVEVYSDGHGRADSLVVRGGGDPSLGTPFHDDPLAPLDSLADSLRARGLRAVDGPVVIDQSRFDSTLVHPAWEAFDLDWYYAAPVAPFAIMSGAFEIVVTPGRVGSPATVGVSHGAGLVGLDARIRTVPGDDDWDDVLRRLPDRDSLVLRGTIGAGSGPDTSWIAQTRPGHTAGMALQRVLERAGIPVTGPVVVRYGAGDGVAGEGVAGEDVAGEDVAGEDVAGEDVAGEDVAGEDVAGEDVPDEDVAGGAATDAVAPGRVVWRSPPLGAIIRVALERSDNWVTEQVLKGMAAVLLGWGDWSSGTDLVEEYLVETVGVPRGAIYMRDGSGLTPQGLLTPDAVATVLRHADARPWGPRLRDALASPGEPESTLDDRLLEYRGRVAAKTGTLRHVNALSGYLTTRDGRELVFSILSNGSGRPSWEVQGAVDRIVESLIESGS